MTFISDLAKGGLWPLQHFDADVSIAKRISRKACRVARNPEGDGWFEVAGTVGDILGGLMWEHEAGDRIEPGWSWAWPTVVTRARGDDPSKTRARNPDPDDEAWALRPLRNEDYEADENFKEKTPALPEFAGPVPKGWTCTVSGATDEKSQQEIALPAFLGLMAPNRFDGTYGTRVFELKKDGEDHVVDEERWAHLQSMMRVVRPAGPLGEANGLAWQLNKSGDSLGLAGYGLCYDSGVVSAASFRMGGPLRGDGACPHQLGATRDGEPEHSLHIDDSALIKGLSGDAPIEWSEWVPPRRGLFLTPAHFAVDLSRSHRWRGRSVPGVRRIEAECYFTVISKDPPLPPPREPQPPPGGIPPLHPPLPPIPPPPLGDPPPLIPIPPLPPDPAGPTPLTPLVPLFPGGGRGLEGGLNPPDNPLPPRGVGDTAIVPIPPSGPKDGFRPGLGLDPELAEGVSGPGNAETVDDEDRDRDVVATPLQVAIAGWIGLPQHFATSKPDYRYMRPGVHDDLREDFAAFTSRPRTINVIAWGQQEAEDWAYTTNPGVGQFAQGTANGGFLVTPPETDVLTQGGSQEESETSITLKNVMLAFACVDPAVGVIDGFYAKNADGTFQLGTVDGDGTQAAAMSIDSSGNVTFANEIAGSPTVEDTFITSASESVGQLAGWRASATGTSSIGQVGAGIKGHHGVIHMDMGASGDIAMLVLGDYSSGEPAVRTSTDGSDPNPIRLEWLIRTDWISSSYLSRLEFGLSGDSTIGSSSLPSDHMLVTYEPATASSWRLSSSASGTRTVETQEESPGAAEWQRIGLEYTDTGSGGSLQFLFNGQPSGDPITTNITTLDGLNVHARVIAGASGPPWPDIYVDWMKLWAVGAGAD